MREFGGLWKSRGWRLVGVELRTTILILHLITTLSSAARVSSSSKRTRNDNEGDAIVFLEGFEETYSGLANVLVLADWAYNTNLTEQNAEAATVASLALSAYSAEAYAEAAVFETTNFSEDTKRQLSKVGSQSLSEEEMRNLSSIISEMGSIYGTGTVCREVDGTEECLALEPELTVLLAESTDAEERLWAWEGWRTRVGRQLRPLYLEYARLKNKLAVLNGYEDYGHQLRMKYESESFETDVGDLYEELKPLYAELHAYIRRKLYNVYGSQVVSLTGPLPQHLLGDMWGRFWTNLYQHAIPFPERPALDVTPALVEQGYTPARMFQVGEEFYTSMGLLPLPSTFYNLSMIEKPEGVEVVCHATAWDFQDGEDFRIKMCTRINFEDFLTIHHELGHVQYFMQYAHQPVLYRDGANDGFHEAVGELMSMCVSTPKHLHAIGLLEELLEDKETELNYLLSIALTTVSTLPFHYVMDLWRWRAFSGVYPDHSVWNDEFWKLSEEIVGVSSPVGRSPEDLDAPTIFHVAQDYDMIRYFTRTILQFQFAESLCDAAGHEGPLNTCDFYGSRPAGDKLAAMLQMGSSQPWPVALEALTSEERMSARAIRAYFKPLEDWLRVTNWMNFDTPGWTTSQP